MESELVSGFMTEHAAVVFVFFFLAEYGSIVLICILNSLLFLGGYLPPIYSIYYLITFIYYIFFGLYYFMDIIVSLILTFYYSWDWWFVNVCQAIVLLLFNLITTNTSCYPYIFNHHDFSLTLQSIWGWTILDPSFITWCVNSELDNLEVFIKSLFFYYPNFEGLLYGLTIGLKSSLMIFTFIWARASFPRIRFDQLMSFCWTVILPILFALIMYIPCILHSFDFLSLSFSLQ